MIKNYPDALFEEMKLLAKFPDNSQLEGIKIHHNASPTMLASAKSLFAKGLITQPDGGYLTDSGLETVDHLHHVLTTLS
jgi:uncharacterized protein (TIGR02647 family)